MTNRANYNDVRKLLGDACRTLADNVSVRYYIPRSISPPTSVILPQFPTVQYLNLSPGESAQWNMIVMYFVGQINEETAQDQTGEMISPGSKLLRALNDAQIRPGYGSVSVSEASLSEMKIGSAVFSYARLDVAVRA